jgi:hypothetical protein
MCNFVLVPLFCIFFSNSVSSEFLHQNDCHHMLHTVKDKVFTQILAETTKHFKLRNQMNREQNVSLKTTPRGHLVAERRVVASHQVKCT